MDAAVYIKERADIIWSQKLLQSAEDIDSSSNYSVDDYLHSGLLIFPNVFEEIERGRAKLEQVIAIEYDTTLWRPAFRLLLFNKNECDINPVKNAVFNWTSKTNFEHIIAMVDITETNWKDQSHNDGTIKTHYSRAEVAVNRIIVNETVSEDVRLSKDLYGIAIVKGTNLSKFQADAWFKIGIQIIHL